MPFPVELTTDQLVALRGDASTPAAHRAAAYISTCPNDEVLTARVNQVVFGASFAQVGYAGAVGDFADVRVGMTVLISHTDDARAAHFVGRIRKAPTAAVLYINETSAAVTDDDYIFVLDDYRVWDKLPRAVDGIPMPDYDVTFRQLLPLIDGLQSAYVEFDASGAHEFEFAPGVAPATDGATISSYLWDVEDGIITVGAATDKDVTVEFPTGFRHIHFTTTDSGGRVSTRHIPVWVHDSDYPATLLEHGDLSITASVDEGYSGSVTAFAGISALLDNTLVVAWQAGELYGDGSGPIYANILLVGRLRSEASQTATDQETSQLDASTQFDIEGPLQQLGRLELVPLQLDQSASPTRFNQVKTLTVWREIALLLTEYSTFHELHSLTFSDTTSAFREAGVVTTGGSILAAINALAGGIGAQLSTAADGAALVARHGCLLPSATRDTLEVVADWTTADIIDLSLGHSHVNPNGRLEASGGSYNSSSGQVVVAQAIAPGKAPGSGEGTSTLHNQILVADLNLASAEAELGRRAGNKFVMDQGADELSVVHPDGYWWLTPAPDRWYTFTLDGSETARGVVLDSTIRWWLSEVTLDVRVDDGTREVRATYRRETEGPPAQAVRYPPQPTTKLALPPFPPLPDFPALGLPPDFFLAADPTLALTPPAMAGGAEVLTRDGNVAVAWTADGVWVCRDLIVSPTPTWIEVTPELGEDDRVVQCRFTGTNPPGLLIALTGASWEYTVDFDTLGSTQQGFEVVTQTFWDPTDLGIFASNDGWAAELACYDSDPNSCSKVLGIGIDFGRDVKFLGIDVELLSPDPLPTFRTLQVGRPPFGAAQGPTDIINTYFTQPSGSPGLDTWVWNGEEVADGLIFWSEFSQGGPAGSQTFQAQEIKSITFRGVGYNPFDPTHPSGPRVVYTPNAFDVALSWDSGEGLPTTDINIMRVGATFNRVYMVDSVLNEAYYSTDFGETFSDAIAIGTPSSSFDGFDTQKLGTAVLGGSDGQVRRATTGGGAFSDYGSALPTGANPVVIFVPRYKFSGANNGTGVSAPDYLVGSDVEASGEALWKVTASGATFTDITPNDGSDNGVSVSPNCVIIPWHSAAYQDILGIFGFGSDRKLARSVNGGSTWAFSDPLQGSAEYLCARRSDAQRKQVFIANGSGILYCAEYRASPMVLQQRTGPTSTALRGVEVWW